MKNHVLTVVVASLTIAISMNTAEAQLGSLLREGVEYLGKRAGKVLKEGAESGARRAGSVADDIASKAAGKVVTTGT